MKYEIRKIKLAALPPLLLLFILYILKILEVGTGLELVRLGIYPLQLRGIPGILTSPLVHSGFSHLLANTVPLFFLSWCLFYFYSRIAYLIYGVLWLGSGLLTFCIGHPGWHIGASGVIYALAFFLFFSGLLRKYVPLVAISLLVTFLYGSIVWNMFPPFARPGVSWEGHLSGAIVGSIAAVVFMHEGPQKPDPFVDEEEETENAGDKEDTDWYANP